MKPFLVAIGALAGVVLVLGLLFWFDARSDDQPAHAPVAPFVQPRAKPIPDGGLLSRPHPDRAGLRYSPKPK